MNIDILEKQLRVDEGVRYVAYKDSEGWWTIGCGHLIDVRKGGKLSPGAIALIFGSDCTYSSTRAIDELIGGKIKINDAAVNFMLREDIENTQKELLTRFPWIAAQDEARQIALMNMAFNLGVPKFSKFTDFLPLVKSYQYELAYHDLVNATLWYKQVKARGERVATVIRTGVL